MDFLSFFVVRTAFPFGYLIFLGLPMLGAVVWGLVLLRRDIRAHPNPGRMRMSWGLVVLTGVALFIGANVAYARALDLNPSLAADDLVGVWRDGGATLTLHPDGTYGCTGGGGCASFGREGKWTHDGSFQLDFAAADADFRIFARRRVVRFAGVLRLTSVIEDPDTWDGVLTFAHRAPAS